MISTNPFLSLNCPVRTDHGLGRITKAGTRKNLVFVLLKNGDEVELKAKDVHALDHRVSYPRFETNPSTHGARERAIEVADFVGHGATVREIEHAGFIEYEMVPHKLKENSLARYKIIHTAE